MSLQSEFMGPAKDGQKDERHHYAVGHHRDGHIRTFAVDREYFFDFSDMVSSCEHLQNINSMVG